MTVLLTRRQIKKGLFVSIETKATQGTGMFVSGIVDEILTSSISHPHGIKVRLQDGQVGRVKAIREVVKNSEIQNGKVQFEDLNKTVIPKTEDRNNEFKEFYQYDPKIENLSDSMPKEEKTRSINGMKRSSQERIATAVCSFGNSHEGGFLYIGIRSDGTISGLDKDKNFGSFTDYDDSFANHIRDMLGKLLHDKTFITGKLNMKFRSDKGKTVCILQVLPSSQPMYLHHEKEEVFYVRGLSPRAEKLIGREQFRYIKDRFPDYK